MAWHDRFFRETVKLDRDAFNEILRASCRLEAEARTAQTVITGLRQAADASAQLERRLQARITELELELRAARQASSPAAAPRPPAGPPKFPSFLPASMIEEVDWERAGFAPPDCQ